MERSTLTHRLAFDFSKQQDELVTKAINFALKRDDWTPEEVKAMGVCEYHKYSDGTEIFAINGVDMIEFYPVQISQQRVGFSTEFSATRNYRWLVEGIE